MGDTITPETFYRHLTGDPGGSKSVRYDTFLLFLVRHARPSASQPDMWAHGQAGQQELVIAGLPTEVEVPGVG